jgi:hypothetical protein
VSDAERQLLALRSVDALLGDAGIAYWLFGGWAVDFHAGRITRPHDDIDIAVWRDDVPRIVVLIEHEGWLHAPYADEDGGTGYERDGVRLELTFLVRRADGRVAIPLRDFDAPWLDDARTHAFLELEGVGARLVGLEALARGKSSPRADAADARKDSADYEMLSEL